MKHRHPWLLILLPALLAAAGEPRIQDNGKFFSDPTIREANEILTRIKKDFDKDVVVETFPAIPDSMIEQYNHQDRRAFFESWLHSRAQHYRVNGVFILICRDPGRLELEPGLKTRQEAFTLSDRDDAIKLIADAFRKKEFDRGLIAGLELIDQRMSRNLGAGSEPQTQPATAPASRPSTAPAGS